MRRWRYKSGVVDGVRMFPRLRRRRVRGGFDSVAGGFVSVGEGAASIVDGGGRWVHKKKPLHDCVLQRRQVGTQEEAVA